jgi:hypothetical protein
MKTTFQNHLGVFPILPVAGHYFRHRFCGGMEPTGWPLRQVAPDGINRVLTTEVYIGGFPSHEIQETVLVSLLRQVVNWNPGAVGRKAAANPRSIHVNKRIAATDRLVEDRLLKDRIGTAATACPYTGRRRERFGFTCSLTPTPIRYGHDSKTSHAPQARYSRYKPIR